jgi:hypothetical protein
VPFDFANIRIHHDEAAVRSIGALAYTLGRDIALGDQAIAETANTQIGPETRPGRILAHELAHVVDDSQRPGPPVVRRQIHPEDVSSEMVGQSMITAGPITTLGGQIPAGATVVIMSWVNAALTARVRFAAAPSGPVEVELSKTLLRPTRPLAREIAPYSAGAAAQAASVTRGEAAIAAEQARRGGPRPGEIPRLTGLQRIRETELNKRLIQETMFNRFDPLIRQWTDHYNVQFGFTEPERLDANLVKSMLFQESQMGTAGENMMPVPPSAISRKSRFNVGQVIDTSGPALTIMMTEIDPALIARHHLTNLRRDMRIAQRRLEVLTHMPHRTPAEEAELAALRTQSQPSGSWENFFWSYQAPASPTTFADAVLEFFTPAPGGVSRQMDYEFWIRTAIRWLFEKRQNVSTWAEAVRAYNGSGGRAQRYRNAVTGRSRAAVEAERAGRIFTPSNT